MRAKTCRKHCPGRLTQSRDAATRRPDLHSPEDHYKETSITHTRLIPVITATLLLFGFGNVHAATVVSGSAIEDTVKFDSTVAHNGRFSGVLANHGTKPIDDVVVLVRYNWLWTDELNPGPDSPEWVEYVTVEEHVAPGETIAFVYAPGGPLPQRIDGFFMPTAEVVGMTVHE